jgi:hypothetical protein
MADVVLVEKFQQESTISFCFTINAVVFRNRVVYFYVPFGAVAQLGERYIRIVEVVGSIPVSSTNHKQRKMISVTERHINKDLRIISTFETCQTLRKCTSLQECTFLFLNGER